MSVRDLDLPDLVAATVDNLRDLVEAETSSLKHHVGERLSELQVAIKAWLIALCAAIVTMMLLGIAIAVTLSQVGGLPFYESSWIVSGIALGSVVLLVLRARRDRAPTVSLAALPPRSETP